MTIEIVMSFFKELYTRAMQVAQKRDAKLKFGDVLVAFKKLKNKPIYASLLLPESKTCMDDVITLIDLYQKAASSPTKKPLQAIGNSLREWVHFDELPKNVKNVVIKTRERLMTPLPRIKDIEKEMFDDIKNLINGNTFLIRPEDRKKIMDIITKHEKTFFDALKREKISEIQRALKTFETKLSHISWKKRKTECSLFLEGRQALVKDIQLKIKKMHQQSFQRLMNQACQKHRTRSEAS